VHSVFHELKAVNSSSTTEEAVTTIKYLSAVQWSFMPPSSGQKK